MTDPQQPDELLEEEATLSDEEISTRGVGEPAALEDDTGDTGDDAGDDTGDDAGDDSGDTADTADTGDDA